MIVDLDETIKQIMIQKGSLDTAEVDISFDTPDREWSSSISRPTINFYLYDIRENHELRGIEWTIEKDRNGTATRKKNPSRIDLSYLITVWTSDTSDEHRLLWHVLLTLFSYPTLPDEVLSGRLVELSCPIKISTAQPDGLLNNPADFWAALDNELRPSVSYVVTLPLDTDMAFTAPVVRTKIVDFKAPDTGKERLVQVAGMVHQAGEETQGIADARVIVKEVGMTTETDNQGHYSFRKLPEGDHTFQVLISGKVVAESVITVPGASYDLEVSSAEE